MSKSATTKGTAVSVTLDFARRYVAAGLSLIPIALDGNKGPAFDLLPGVWSDTKSKYERPWKPYRERLPTDAELVKWFGKDQAGIAIVFGEISGGAECIDIDDPQVGVEFHEAVAREAPELHDKLVWVCTPSYGLHAIYRCEEIAGNKKLAYPQAILKGQCEASIETRGVGGYAVTVGSPARVHQANEPYTFLRRGLAQIQEITIQERDYLLRLAMSFDYTPSKPIPSDPTPVAVAPSGAGSSEMSPAQDFEARGVWQNLLESSGARLAVGTWAEGKIVRPGKELGYSASLGFCRASDGAPLLRVFTTSWPPLEVGQAYGKFQFFRLVKCGGDGKRAMRELRELGYGGQTRAPLRIEAPPEAPADQGNPNGGTAQGVSASAVWGPHISLTDAGDDPPEFPLEVLPKPLAEILQDVAHSVNDCAVDYPASFALAVLAGTVGGRFDLVIKQNYHEIACLYMCLVGHPGDGKTPSCSALMRPLSELQGERRRKGDDEPVYVDDFTLAVLAPILQKYPRGTLAYRDELSGWVNSMDQFKSGGKGDDRQRWLSINSGSSFAVMRKGAGTEPVNFFVQHPRVSVVGGIQPGVLDRLREDSKGDGFYDRFLFTFPKRRPAKKENWKIAQKQNIERWGEALERIRVVEMDQTPSGRPVPYQFTLDPSGRQGWEDWTGWTADYQTSENFPEMMLGPLAKMKGYVGRLALILHLADQAFAGSLDINERVSGLTISRASEIGKYYLKHAERVYRASGRDPRILAATAILSWIQRRKEPSFRRSDLWSSVRRNCLFSKPEDLLPSLRLLEEHRYVRLADTLEPPKVGRPMTDLYEVNPSFLSAQ